jgi:hypothetical protein
VRVRATRPEDREGLRALGDVDGDVEEGVVFVARRDLTDWPEVERELTEAFRLAQQASEADAPLVFVVESDALLGRGGPFDSMVATGLVSGARTLAFEGVRKGRYVGIIATDRSDEAGDLGEAIQYAVASRAGHGQVVTLGTGHVGAMFP